jgi:hypothetical protein
MKRFITIALMAGISTCGFAMTSSADKSSQQLSSIGSAWKAYRSVQPKESKNDIEMVYGGEDIKNPALIQTVRA